MNILAFDTSGTRLSVALETSSGRFASLREAGLRHGELLAPLIESILKEADLSTAELELIVCARGPGSFTGLRIGMATAKGMATGLGIPVVSVAVPDFLAMPFQAATIPVIPLQDAKKGRFYGSIYLHGERQSDYFDLAPADILNLAESGTQTIITGPDAAIFMQLVADRTARHTLIPVSSDRGAVFDLLDMGRRLLLDMGPDASGQGPLYLRQSEAEISRQKLP